MRFKPASRSGRVLPMDLTAMVDVVFLLIIFFLTTSSLVEITREPVDLPVESGEEIQAEGAATIIVNVTEEGRIFVEGEGLTRIQLLEKVAYEVSIAAEPLDLLIRADEAASLAIINELAEGVADLGIRSWRIATQVPYEGVGTGGDG